ncbi:MAG: hypothetical protein WC027_02250 [Candidatus Paceibacterota bacterium]
MNPEIPPIEPSPEELSEQEQAELLAMHKARHPEQFVEPESLREAGPEIAQFEAMVAAFEIAHPLAEMEAITDISPNLATVFRHAKELSSDVLVTMAVADFEKYNPSYVDTYKQKIAEARAIVLTSDEQKIFNTRESARRDISPIVALLKKIKDETNISAEKYEELWRRRNAFELAIGSIKHLTNPGKVVH